MLTFGDSNQIHSRRDLIFSILDLYFKLNNPIFISSYHVPEIRIVTVEPLRVGQPSELLLKFINPTQHQTVISILHLSSLPENLREDEFRIEPSTEDSKTVEVFTFSYFLLKKLIFFV